MGYELTKKQQHEFDRLAAETPIAISVDEFISDSVDQGFEKWRKRLESWKRRRAEKRREDASIAAQCYAVPDEVAR